MQVTDEPVEAERRRTSLLLVGLGYGPFVGFVTPLGFFQVAEVATDYPGAATYLLAFGLPFVLGGAFLIPTASRPWGVALLSGTALGTGILLTWLWLLLSALD